VRADQGSDQQEKNQKQLEAIRKDPEEYSRLTHRLSAFLKLPPEEQERMRKLDHDLNRENIRSAGRLERALERYVTWLESLPQSDRQLIESAPNADERLRRIRDVRQQQWISHLAKGNRDRLQKLTGKDRESLLQQLRKEVKDRRHDWAVAIKNWNELLNVGQQFSHLKDFPQPVQAFFQNVIAPKMTKAEADRLQAAEGQWPLYPRILVELADLYSPALPGPEGPKRFRELPKDLQERLQKLKPAQRARLYAAEGKWPDFAMRVTELAHRQQIPLSKQLGACRPEEFSIPISRFIKSELEPALKTEQLARLKSAEGRWPGYPLTLVNQARLHHLQIPGMHLPGRQEYWDRFRVQAASALPELDDAVLRDFALKELTRQERAALSLFPFDTASRARLKQEYFKRHPPEADDQKKKDAQ
jgi:hypothetical protein